ncbi:MAG: 3'-5' exonuclease [Myxococcota bacterium]
MPRATWFCIDIECSGPVPALYDCLSIGAVAVTGRPPTPGASTYLEIRPGAPRVDAGAMAVNGLSLERLAREGLALGEALARLTAFVEEHTRPGTKPVFVGHNAPFDWSFVSYAYAAEGLQNPFGYKALDTKALASGVLGVHWLDSNKETLEQLLDLPPQDPDQVHRADYDAAYQARILAALLVRMPEAAPTEPARHPTSRGADHGVEEDPPRHSYGNSATHADSSRTGLGPSQYRVPRRQSNHDARSHSAYGGYPKSSQVGCV